MVWATFTGEARERLTTSSSANRAAGATAAWRGAKAVGRKQRACGLLGICQRQVTASFPKASRHLRKIKHAPEVAKTLGEHLRLARIDRGLKQTEVARVSARITPQRRVFTAMTATPNHALQRTATAVTLAASAAAFPPTVQPARQPPPSLSLGSLGVATRVPK